LKPVHGTQRTIFIKKSEKRLLEKYFRKRMIITKFYPSLIFSVVVAILINESKVDKSVLIDTEYPGHNKFIKDSIEDILVQLKNKNTPTIKFGFVGKESKSDYLASKVRKGKLKPSQTIKAEDIIKIVFENKKSGNT
jgi:hypothetical protein